jgi:hypothetical protein
VNYALGSQVVETPIDISHNPVNILVLKAAPLLKVVFKVPLVAKLSNYVAVSVAGKHLQTAQHIGMVELFQHCDLLKEKLL